MKVEVENYTRIDNHQLCLQIIGNICTRLPILTKKDEERKEKLRRNHTYVSKRKKEGVMPFIENSNVYMYIYIVV
jgi:hypothetical protein